MCIRDRQYTDAVIQTHRHVIVIQPYNEETTHIALSQSKWEQRAVELPFIDFTFIHTVNQRNYGDPLHCSIILR